MPSKREILFTIFTIFWVCNNISSEIVETENGEVAGTILQTWTDLDFHAFYGIPFAKAPINELRFQPPVPAESWTGVREATEYGPICMQSFPNSYVKSEDCLNLNIFTRNLQSTGATELKPVIVFLHGGALEFGAGIEQQPHYIMDRDIVFVTINYRLGALGFLATGTEDAPGNLGLKDVVMALKWIKTNIKSFGGNPDKVTLAGLSAGSYSNTALLASPMAEKLFHGVISMSGAITWQMGLANHHLDTAIALGKQLNCTDERPKELVTCLKTVSKVYSEKNWFF